MPTSLSRIVLLYALLLPHATHAQDAAAPKYPIAERLAACAVCHGARGEGAPGAEYYPHLAGKPAGYLYAQLQGFRDGRRHYPQMVWLMRFMDDRWLAEIAAWYAAQPPHTTPHAGAPITSEAAALAQRLVVDGDPARDLPPCAACHGDALTGVAPAIPALVGLPAEYIVAQFGGWVAGVRRAPEPDCMAAIARTLRPDEIRALATWLSQQPSPADAAPAAAHQRELPIACGSVTHASLQQAVSP